MQDKFINLLLLRGGKDYNIKKLKIVKLYDSEKLIFIFDSILLNYNCLLYVILIHTLIFYMHNLKDFFFF